MRVATVGAGSRAARRLRRAGFDVVVIKRLLDKSFDNGWWTLTTDSGPVRVQVLVGGRLAAGPNVIPLPANNFLAVRYVLACLRMMVREDAREISVRPTRRAYWRRPDPYDFVLTPYEGDIDDTHRSPARLTADGVDIDVHVHLMGHLQPIDGSYRWYGRVAKHPAVTGLQRSGRRDVTLRLPGGDPVPARLTELDPWGNARIAGVGRPPFPYP